MRADMSDKTRDSFIFYRSFFESTLPLNKEEKAELFDAICRYALDAEQINLQGFPQAMFSLIKPQLDANRKKWLNGCKEKTKSKEESIDEQQISKSEAKAKQDESKSEGNVNVECKSKSELGMKITIPKPKGFTPPTLEEVKTYCIERNNAVSPAKFFDYYNAGKWSDGKGNKIKNWKQKLITWEGRTNDGGCASNSNINQHTVDSVNKIANHTLLHKIIITTSNKAVLYFSNSIDYENWRKNEELREQVKEKIIADLKVVGFELPKFIN
jgi:hypothetical protein